MMKLETRYLMTLQLFADPPPATLKGTPHGERQIMRIQGGEFSGERLEGKNSTERRRLDPQPNRSHDSAQHAA